MKPINLSAGDLMQGEVEVDKSTGGLESKTRLNEKDICGNEL